MTAVLDRPPVREEEGVQDEAELWLIAKRDGRGIDTLYLLTMIFHFSCYGEDPNRWHYKVNQLSGWIRYEDEATHEVYFYFDEELMFMQFNGNDEDGRPYIHVDCSIRY